jgi:hypothetical protein
MPRTSPTTSEVAKVDARKKRDVLDAGKELAERHGHSMQEFVKNGKGLLLATCSECGHRLIVHKKDKNWYISGTAANYVCDLA